jgi:membrane-associated phospholipid phosphatase
MTAGILHEGLARRLGVQLKTPATIRQLTHILPAVALLWMPVVIALWARLPGSTEFDRGLPMFRVMLICGLAPLLVAGGIARLRGRTWAGAGRLLWSEGWITERPVRHLLMSVSLSAFFWVFACWKSAIPLVHPFAWDERLWSLGATIHGGQPDVLLAPIFGSPSAIVALDRLYETWWFVLVGLLMWQIWQRDLAKAKRFLLAFALVWIVLGIFVATMFSSAGPCHTLLLTGTHRYDELLARLHVANALSPLTVIEAQKYLWSAYMRGLVPPGGGISAFPSLHVAGATLAALALYERSRVLGTVAWIYMALMMVASIMLGWHYSLDGYMAVLGTAACWVAAGRLTTPIPDGSRRTATWREPQPDIGVAEAAGVHSSSGNAWTMWP